MRGVVHTDREDSVFSFLDITFPRRTVLDSLCEGLSDSEAELFYISRFFRLRSRCLIDDAKEDET